MTATCYRPDHLLYGLLLEEASWDAFFEHSGIKPILVLYENFAADYETSTLSLLKRLDLSCPDDFEFEPRMKRQSDRTGSGRTGCSSDNPKRTRGDQPSTEDYLKCF